MTAKPSTLPRWSELVGNFQIAGANETVPASGKQDTGWIPGEEPPAGYLNWYQRVVYDWIQFLNDSPVFVPTTTNAAGLTSTGNGTGSGIVSTGGVTGTGGQFTGGATSGPGVTAQGGGGNSNGSVGQGTGTGAGALGTGGPTGPGLRGVGGTNSAPLNLVPRTLPATLNDGDIWSTTASLFARINGVTKDLLGGNTYVYAFQISGAPSIPNSTDTVVVYLNEVSDVDNAYNLATGTFVVPANKGGTYYLAAGIEWNTFGATVPATGEIHIKVNATFMIDNPQRYSASSQAINASLQCAGIVQLAAGDTVQVWVFQNSGSAASLTGSRDAFFIAKRIPD